MEGTSRELITESIANTNERVNPAHRSARKPEREERDRIHTARKLAGYRRTPILFSLIFYYYSQTQLYPYLEHVSFR
jgi:hypothetical protein